MSRSMNRRDELYRRQRDEEADGQYPEKRNRPPPIQQTSPWLNNFHADRNEFTFHDPKPVRARWSEPSFSEYQSPNLKMGSGSNSNRKSLPKRYSFEKGDGPPPDPVYNFLADPERDPERPERARRPVTRDRGRLGRGRPGDGNRGSNRPAGVGRGGAGDRLSRPDYDAWRAERDRIDEERINRQKTADGQWRREWDNQKTDQEHTEMQPTSQSGRGTPHRDVPSPKRRERDGRAALLDFVHSEDLPEADDAVPAPKSNRGQLRGRRRIVPENVHTTPPKQMSKAAGEPSMDDWKEKENMNRKVQNVGNSIQICLSNSSPPISTPAPVQRVKVCPKSVIGSGRVGPRQKVRLSYSSQSEDEQCPRPPRNHHRTRPRQKQGELRPQNAGNTVEVLQKPGSTLSKPPLPPNEDTNPKLQRKQRSRQQGGRRSTKTTESESSEVENKNVEESSESNIIGDDSWEDVTTTSGNESVCELSEDALTPTRNPTSSMKSNTDSTVVDKFQRNAHETALLTEKIDKLSLANESTSSIKCSVSTPEGDSVDVMPEFVIHQSDTTTVNSNYETEEREMIGSVSIGGKEVKESANCDSIKEFVTEEIAMSLSSVGSASSGKKETGGESIYLTKDDERVQESSIGKEDESSVPLQEELLPLEVQKGPAEEPKTITGST